MGRPPTPCDFSVVIPTRDRWPILQRTLDTLRLQDVSGFETIVVVDGTDQRPPDLDDVTVVVRDHAGPGAARNAGAEQATRDIILFLGDDMLAASDLIARHLECHQKNWDAHVAVLGHVGWHPDVAKGRIQRWLDWSSTQFDYTNMVGPEAGWGRLYSSNLSIKRDFFLDVSGFDEEFDFAYEDTDLAWRLNEKGLRLLYEPCARTSHHHRYDWSAIQRRFRLNGSGESTMVQKHPGFPPYFLYRVLAARAQRSGARRLSPWPWLVDRVPASASRLRQHAERRADAWYYDRLAEPFLQGWAAAADLHELQAYLGENYDRLRLYGHHLEVEAEHGRAGDEQAFYRTSQAYLYDLTAFAMTGTKGPYLAELRRLLPEHARVLDYGCGIGADGLRLIQGGYEVSFADFANPSTTYLRWRLQRRGLEAAVYDLDQHVPGGFDAIYSFDVIEHVDDPFAFLDELEQRAGLVAVNFLEPDADDTHLHRPLPISALLDHAARRGLLRYRRYHDRSHLVVYRSAAGPRVPATRSLLQRHLGSRLPGLQGWSPVPLP